MVVDRLYHASIAGDRVRGRRTAPLRVLAEKLLKLGARGLSATTLQQGRCDARPRGTGRRQRAPSTECVARPRRDRPPARQAGDAAGKSRVEGLDGGEAPAGVGGEILPSPWVPIEGLLSDLGAGQQAVYYLAGTPKAETIASISCPDRRRPTLGIVRRQPGIQPRASTVFLGSAAGFSAARRGPGRSGHGSESRLREEANWMATASPTCCSPERQS